MFACIESGGFMINVNEGPRIAATQTLPTSQYFLFSPSHLDGKARDPRRNHAYEVKQSYRARFPKSMINLCLVTMLS